MKKHSKKEHPPLNHGRLTGGTGKGDAGMNRMGTAGGGPPGVRGKIVNG